VTKCGLSTRLTENKKTLKFQTYPPDIGYNTALLDDNLFKNAMGYTKQQIKKKKKCKLEGFTRLGVIDGHARLNGWFDCTSENC